MPSSLLPTSTTSAYRGRMASQTSVVIPLALSPLPLATDDVIAIAVTLASAVTITAAAANVTAAIVDAAAATATAVVVTDAQWCQWGGWSTSAARGGDNNGVVLVKYPKLWCANPYNSRGDGLALSLGSSPGQYASLFGNLPAVRNGLYPGGRGNATLGGLSCFATINIKGRR